MKKQILLTTVFSVPLVLLSGAWTPDPSGAVEPRAALDEDDDAVKEEKVRELLELTHAREAMERNLDQMMVAFEDIPMLPAGFAELFRDSFDIDHMIDLTVPIYMEHLELATIEAAIAFYEAEPGQKFAAAQPDIAVESTAVGQEYGRELGQEVARQLTK